MGREKGRDSCFCLLARFAAAETDRWCKIDAGSDRWRRNGILYPFPQMSEPVVIPEILFYWLQNRLPVNAALPHRNTLVDAPLHQRNMLVEAIDAAPHVNALVDAIESALPHVKPLVDADGAALPHVNALVDASSTESALPHVKP